MLIKIDSNELARLRSNLTSQNIQITKEYKALTNEVSKLELVSGYDLEELTRLFATGYKLAPPKTCKFSDLMRVSG